MYILYCAIISDDFGMIALICYTYIFLYLTIMYEICRACQSLWKCSSNFRPVVFDLQAETSGSKPTGAKHMEFPSRAQHPLELVIFLMGRQEGTWFEGTPIFIKRPTTLAAHLEPQSVQFSAIFS